MILSAFRRIASPATGHPIILVVMSSIGLDASKQEEGWEKSTVVPDNASCPYFFFNMILLHLQIRCLQNWYTYKGKLNCIMVEILESSII
jgi:hypothetical protein